MTATLNTTMNATQSLAQSSSCYNPTAAKISQTVAYCLIFVVSMTGNIFIGIIVYKTRTMRKPINFLIVNMAMSDLLFPIILIPRELTLLYVDSWPISGPLGQASCKLVAFLPDVSVSVSIQSLVLIVVDQFGAVVFPLRSPLISSKLCPFSILATWIVAMAIHSPAIFANKFVEYPEGWWCLLQWNEVFGESSSYENYSLAMFVLFYYTPLVLIAMLYTIIVLKLKTQTIPGEQSANVRQQRVKREQNVLKMSIAIVLGFAVSYLPYSIVWIWFHSELNILSCGFGILWTVAAFMMFAYCAINPCICFMFSRNYRQALKNLLRCF